jgi:hypothetical protein
MVRQSDIVERASRAVWAEKVQFSAGEKRFRSPPSRGWLDSKMSNEFVVPFHLTLSRFRAATYQLTPSASQFIPPNDQWVGLFDRREPTHNPMREFILPCASITGPRSPSRIIYELHFRHRG